MSCTSVVNVQKTKNSSVTILNLTDEVNFVFELQSIHFFDKWENCTGSQVTGRDYVM